MKSLAPKLRRCPTCQRTGLRRAMMDVTVAGRKEIARNVQVDLCPHCGEQLYDPPAMRAIEAAIPVRRRRRKKTVA